MFMKLILGAVVVGTVVSGGVAVDSAMAPEANAAACWGQITQSKGKNYTGCGAARHFVAVGASLQIKTGNRATANKWSYEPVCWAGIRKYGMVRSQ